MKVVILHLCKQVLHVDNTSEEFVGFVAALFLEKPSSAFEWLFWYFFIDIHGASVMYPTYY